MHRIDYFPVLSSLVAGELARMRKCSELEAELAIAGPSTEIGDRDLGIDSLNLLQLASAVSQMFHLSETGVDEYLLRYRKLADWAEIVSVSLKKKAECITFRTSGSSGKPKPCTHRVTDLQREVSLHAESYPACRRVLTLVPRHRIYGFLWTVMLPARLGVDTVDARRWMPSRLADEIRPGDLLVGTPSTWQRLSDELDVFSPAAMAVTSGAPCPAALFHRLQAQGLALTEIYGASETAGLGRRNEPESPFELLPYWSRGSSGTLSRVSDNNGERREFEIPDHLDWRGDRHFFVRGRKDDAVQVLGTNVFPGHVADAIRGHPRVKECAVRLMQPAEGDRLKAFVVPRDAEWNAGNRDELSSWLRSRLQPHERPASIVFGPELPRDESGKLTDWDCLC